MNFHPLADCCWTAHKGQMTEIVEFANALFPLCLTMMISGSAGGIAAFLTTSQPAASQVRFGIYGFASVGMIAALTVPLFLSLLQSKLLDNVKSSQNGEAFLIFAGFCILAGFSAKTFLSSLSDRVINELKDKMADGEKRAQVQLQELKDNLAYARQHQDQDAPSDTHPLSPKLGQIERSLNPIEKVVLGASARLAVRTIDGIAQDCDLSGENVEAALLKLIEQNLAKEVKPPGLGSRLFALTEDGLQLAARLAVGAVV